MTGRHPGRGAVTDSLGARSHGACHGRSHGSRFPGGATVARGGPSGGRALTTAGSAGPATGGSQPGGPVYTGIPVAGEPTATMQTRPLGLGVGLMTV